MTGEYRGYWRWVNRRYDPLAGRSKGYLVVNDGPAVAAQLARHMQQRQLEGLPVYGPLTARQARILELRQRLR